MPSTQIEPPVGDGNGEAHTAENRFSVSRHIVNPFEGVLVFGTSFRYETVEDGLHIDTDIRVAVLVDGESATGVLGEDVDDACTG